MSGDEDFLSRWSRRKRAAAELTPPPVDAVDTPAVQQSIAEFSAPDKADEKGETEGFDLASLPSIDSIVESTDITAFLKQGVPPALTREALRRAWSADPAIRDFIGLAENAWDFNDPNAMPGFGPLDQSPEEIRQMLARIMGEVERGAEEVLSPDEAASGVSPAKISDAVAGTRDADGLAELSATEPAVDPQFDPSDQASMPHRVDVAVQHPEANSGSPMLRRTHGGALPR
jgi:hypothetical protein